MTRKNKKHIDPRYFLHENVQSEEVGEEEVEETSEVGDNNKEEDSFPPKIKAAKADLSNLSMEGAKAAQGVVSTIESAFEGKFHASLEDIKGALADAGLELSK